MQMQASQDAAPTVTRTDDFKAFQSAVSSSFVPLEVSTDDRQRFDAKLWAAGADGVMFTEVNATPHLVERTASTIETGGSGYYKVSLLLAGSSILVQDGREIVMRPGDLSFYDTSRPYSLIFGERFRNLIMMFPKDRMEFPAVLTDTLTAVSLGEQHALARIIAPFMAQASPQLPQLPSLARTKLAHTSLDLINTMLSAILDVEADSRDPHQLLLQQIYAYINSNLGSPDLSPGSIAAAHFISTRQVHAIFAQHDTTVSTVIRQRRLERAREDLADPGQSRRTVAAIAAQWGFADAAHFSRVFKQAYGISPRALRAH